MVETNKMGLAIKIFVVIFLVILCPALAGTQSLGPNCEPSGLIAKGKEAWDPKGFWTTQLKKIKEYVEAQKTAYQLSMIERKRDMINERLDDEEMKTMGIEQISDPEFDREMAKIDREILQMDRQMLNGAIEWGRKCTAYANMKLTRLKK